MHSTEDLIRLSLVKLEPTCLSMIDPASGAIDGVPSAVY
jgi:hypothetical protein